MLINHPDFDGMEWEEENAEDGSPISLTAIIYVKNRSRPVRVKEYFDECKRNTDPWNNMPHRMMRNRVICQASRVAFGFTGVKDEEEAEAFINVESTTTSTDRKQLPATPPPTIVPPADGKTPQSELESLVVTAGYTFNDVQKFGIESGNIEGADSMASFSEVPTEVCRRLLRAKTGLLTNLEAVAKGAK